MSTATLPPQANVPFAGGTSTRWIISKREDLTWFIGSALAGYLALGLMVAGTPVLPIFLVWLLLVDGPHVFSTVTRTYFDRAERARLGWFLWIPVPLLLVGPAMALAGQATLFFLLAVCWQHFHIVKQHFGFVMLYKAKNRERGRLDFLLDRWFLLTSLFLPLGLFVLRTQPALSFVRPLRWLATALICGYAALAAAWVLRQAQKRRAGTAMNWPKVGLLAAVVPLQWLALLYASHYGAAGIIRAGIVLGLFHSFQYHRLMWFHNRNRYTQPGAAERNGLAARLATNLGKYLAVAIGLHFLVNYLPQAIFPSQVLQSAAWGISFTHYMMDARIWHVRSDKELATALQMG